MGALQVPLRHGIYTEIVFFPEGLRWFLKRDVPCHPCVPRFSSIRSQIWKCWKPCQISCWTAHCLCWWQLGSLIGKAPACTLDCRQQCTSCYSDFLLCLGLSGKSILRQFAQLRGKLLHGCCSGSKTFQKVIADLGNKFAASAWAWQIYHQRWKFHSSCFEFGLLLLLIWASL